MAIDTRDKRASALSHFGFLILPIPNGTIDADDRRHVAGFYRGIVAGEPEAGPIPNPTPVAGESMDAYCLSTLSAGAVVELPAPSAGESTVNYCISTLASGETIQDYCLTTLEGGAPI